MPNTTRGASKTTTTTGIGGSKSTEDASMRQAKANANQRPPSSPPRSGMEEAPAADSPSVPGEVARELAKLYALILEKSDSHDKKLEEIRITTCATESKLVDIASRISNVEGRLGFLEDAQERLEANPPATSKEVEVLREKLDDVENRERRCNLRFVGFPESCENNDAVAFLEGIIPTLFDIDFAKGLEIDRAHRLGAMPRRQDGDQSTRPRAIIARFLRFQDRECIAEAARKKGNVIWGGRRIMVFPDYSRMLNEKRAKFKDCKKLLHDKNIRFSLNYPAVLVVKTAQGPMRFEDHKRAMSFIHSLN
ncbi:unnamed protein product [Knipowitschia caucasica]|uniref:L1 transposable element RRM domain-containing protein n=1 Tax=Knipowitschia caucasica TaxID=637954 RepID=A0AAV2LGB2_KNICA